MKTNERYVSDLTPELFRDFLFRAAVSFARVGYDVSGDMWAVVDESDATLPEITYSDGWSIFANEGVAMPDGNFLEWASAPAPKGRGGRGRIGSEYPACFRLQDGLPLLMFQGEKWFTEVSEAETFDSPTVPANRIEEMAREALAKS